MFDELFDVVLKYRKHIEEFGEVDAPRIEALEAKIKTTIRKFNRLHSHNDFSPDDHAVRLYRIYDTLAGRFASLYRSKEHCKALWREKRGLKTS